MKTKDKEETVITFKATEDFKKRLQAMAEKENRSVSNYIKTVLEKTMKGK
jgi:predicted transcriptional regulator